MILYIKKTLTIFLISSMAIGSQVLLKKGLSKIGGFQTDELLRSVLAMIMNIHIIAAAGVLIVLSVLYFTLLSKMSLSSLYPIVIGANFVVLVIMSALFLNEPFQLIKLLGLILILGGIMVLSFA